MKRCLGCMEEYDEGYEVCPHCGHVEGQKAELAIHMSPGLRLIHGETNDYTIGKTIGYGGFGVTYLAWDNYLNRKVAIKEYLPSEFSTRGYGETMVTVFDGDKRNQYNNGLEKFVDEAKRLAKFSDQPGIVRVYDAFRENETAYIVMEYLDGMTLKEYMAENGTFDYQMTLDLLLPVMQSLKAVHEEGIIHRDIAPDNIMITKDGQIKLIDFGAARYATTTHSRSLSVIIKPGYSPEEQYRSRGDQGPWTDVYAIGATAYKMITGKTPPEALERRAFFEKKGKDILDPLSKYVKDIPKDTETAILNSLNIRIEDRTPDMDAFIGELTSEEPVKRRNGKIKIIDVLRWPLWAKISVPAATVALSVLGVLFAMGIIGFSNNIVSDIIVPEGMTRVPAVVNQNLTDAEELIYFANLSYTIAGKAYSGYVPKDYVLSQGVNAGYLTNVNSIVPLVVSGGPELATVPNIEYMLLEEGLALLTESGFTAETKQEHSNVVPAGYIIAQDIAGGEEAPLGSVLLLTVSLGRDETQEITEKTIICPDFVGMSYEEAIAYAIENELTITVNDRKYTEKYPADTVMGQDVAAGTKMSNLTAVGLTISLGVRYVKVPDVVFFGEEKAVLKLTESELTVKISYQESDIVTEGLVISQSVEAGENVLPQTEVSLVISKGKGSFELPLVTGMSEAEALSQLQALGLTVKCSYEESEKVASGNVISQKPAQGTEVRGGSEVALTVSSGETLYTVPDVVGMKHKEALSKLKNENFDAIVNAVYHDTVENGIVVSQTLPAGGQYRKDTEIAIEVSKGKEPFTLTFDGNGGKAKKDSKTVYFGTGFGELPKAEMTGHTFSGWYTSAVGGDAVNDASVLSQRGNQTVYAHWTPNSYTVTLDAQGGSLSANTVVVTYNAAYGTLPVPTREHYEFSGWYAGKTKIEAGTLYTSTSNETLSAQWSLKPYTLSFDANGGSASDGRRTVYYGNSYGELPNADRTGYTFGGWYTEASGGSSVNSSTSYPGGDKTLYAHWTANTYTINLNANGGTVSQGTATATYDAAYPTLPKPERAGYTFDNWYTAAEGGSTVSGLYKETSGQTLYAHWKANNYKITWNANGGKSNSETNIDYGNSYTTPTVAKTGYTFKGWYTAAEGGSQITGGIYETAADSTYYAQWTANEYTITWNNDGSTSTSTVKYNDSYTVPALPTKTGYTCTGWYTAKTGGSKITGGTYTKTENPTYFAQWTVNSYTITFDGNGGAGTSVTKNYGETCALPSITRDYYTFQGWFTAESGGSKVTSIKVNGDVTYYAHWTQKDQVKDVLITQVPTGAMIVERSDYYLSDVTEVRTEEFSPGTGWTQVDGTKKVSRYDDNNVTWSGTWSDTPIAETDAIKVKTQEVDVKQVLGYQYGRYRCSDNHITYYQSLAEEYAVETGTIWWAENKYSNGYGPRLDPRGTYVAPGTNETIQTYGEYAWGSTTHGQWYWESLVTQDVKQTQYMSGTRAAIYKYDWEKVTPNQRTTTDPTGNAGVSNVRHYVSYIPK